VSFLRRHALFAGTTGSGKSGGLNVLMATLAACDDVVIWAIDLKNGMDPSPWAPCIDRLATSADEAVVSPSGAEASFQACVPAEAGCCQVGADGSSPCSAFMSRCSASCGSEVLSTVPP
jgi:hypothetical protein